MSVLHSCFPAAGPIGPVAPSGARLGGDPAAARDVPVARPPGDGPGADRPLHCLGEVRRQEGLRPHTVARRLGISIGQLLAQEQPTADIRLSDLYRWQAALGVPASELLEESGCDFSRPTRLRTTLLRVMKTVRSIQEQAQEDSIRRLAGRLAGDLVGMMPELEGTAAWPTLGQRGKARDPGQAFFRRISLDAMDDLDGLEE